MVSNSIHFLQIVIISFSLSSVQFHFLAIVTSAAVNGCASISVVLDLESFMCIPKCYSWATVWFYFYFILMSRVAAQAYSLILIWERKHFFLYKS